MLIINRMCYNKRPPKNLVFQRRLKLGWQRDKFADSPKDFLSSSNNPKIKPFVQEDEKLTLLLCLKGNESLSYYVRPMCQEDVDQVNDIDLEGFPTQWPPPNYQHELRNRLAHYIVTCDEEKTVEQPEVKTSSEKGSTRLVARLRQLFRHNRLFKNRVSTSSGHYIIGFAGFWVMADEAHIISIAVREAYRREGIGELLLISLIDLARELKARIVALEVRTSNTAAQSLYVKYGFTQVGIRRGYYIDRGYHLDNSEDALLMSTQDITSAAFQAHLEQLKQARSRNLGIALNQIAR